MQAPIIFGLILLLLRTPLSESFVLTPLNSGRTFDSFKMFTQTHPAVSQLNKMPTKIRGTKTSTASTPRARNKTSNSKIKAKPQKQNRKWTNSPTTITGTWRELYIELKSYVDKHGHTRVPYNYPANPRLGRWVTRQRKLYQNLHEKTPEQLASQLSSSVLTEERIAALQEIGFQFQSSRTHSWPQRYDELCLYRAIHGDCLVPLHCKDFPGLGTWVRNQRTQYRNLLLGRKQPTGKRKGAGMSPEKIKALQSVGFVWDSQREDFWKKRFDELMDFQAVYGHCFVPENYHENPQLGIWVSNQRAAYKQFVAGSIGGNSNVHVGRSIASQKDSTVDSAWRPNGGKSLTKEKIAALESIGFCWTQTTYNWFSMHERLKEYVDEQRQRYLLEHAESEKDITLPQFFYIPPEAVQERDLRLWVVVQRHEYSSYMYNQQVDGRRMKQQTKQSPLKKRSSMTIRRINALDKIGFPWHVSNKKLNGSSSNGPSVDDWSKLFDQMREKGIDSSVRPKEHWFEGESLLNIGDPNDIERDWSDVDLMDLWNMEDDDDLPN